MTASGFSRDSLEKEIVGLNGTILRVQDFTFELFWLKVQSVKTYHALNISGHSFVESPRFQNRIRVAEFSQLYSWQMLDSLLLLNFRVVLLHDLQKAFTKFTKRGNE